MTRVNWRGPLHSLSRERKQAGAAKPKLDVRMPEPQPLQERHALLSGRDPRELRLLVRPRDGAVVLVLRGAGDVGSWEIAADTWRGVSERVAEAQANPRLAGAAILLGTERCGFADATLSAVAEALSTLAEQE